MPRRFLLFLAFFLTTLALGLMVTGGFVVTAGQLRISARSPVTAFVLAGFSLLAWFVAARRSQSVGSDLAAVAHDIDAHSTSIVLCLALAAACTAVVFHTFSAAGADASGYLSHARMLLAGSLMLSEPLAAGAQWADGAATLAPLGWRVAFQPGFQVPTYAIGLPLLIAPFQAVAGDTGAALVVPATLAIAITATAMLARRLAGASAAVIAAVWFATSPVGLIESMQIMSDVPATAAWLACWWFVFRQQPLSAGAAAAMAILIRPNLAMLAVVPALYVARANDDTVPVRSRRRTFLRLTAFATPVAIAGCGVGYLQWQYFGSPFRSGYGTAQEIYSLSNVAPNARLYATWLLESHGVWLFVAPLALLVKKSRREQSALFVFACLVVALYLIYAVFEVWTYLRFMLPALAVGMIGMATLIAAVLSRLPAPGRVSGLALVALAVASVNIDSARAHGVFQLADRQARARVVGERLATFLPVNAVIVSGEQSGAMRYYTGRSILRWDLIDDDAVRDAMGWLALNGYQVWVVLDDWEEEAFRRKLPELASASLDHRPVFESLGGVGIRTRAWKAAVLGRREIR